MKKKDTTQTLYDVKYELRSTHTRTMEAASDDEARQIVCKDAWRRHRDSIYEIVSVERRKS